MKKKIITKTLALAITCLALHTTAVADHIPSEITGTENIFGTITLENDVIIRSGGRLNINGELFTAGYNIIVEGGGIIDLTVPNAKFHIHPNSTIFIDKYGNLTGDPTGTVNCYGTIHNAGTIDNYSNVTLNVYGTIYNYNTIENGAAEITGTINIHYLGNIFNLSGTIENIDAASGTSVININQGGSLYNYYGTIIIDPAEDDGEMNLLQGGKFHNVPGSSNPPTSISAGGEFAQDAEVNIDKDLEIHYTWTIYQKAAINGYGNKITFGPNGGISIAKDASLLLEDVILNDVSKNKIRCLDPNATLSINNVTWNQDADYTFSWGTIFVENEWLIQGKDTTFNYTSDQTLTITYNATLNLNQTTFHYDTAPNNLIDLADSAIIHPNYATWKASQDCTVANGNLYTTGLARLWGNNATLDISGLEYLNINGNLERVGTII